MHDRVAVERKIREIFERKLDLTLPSAATDLFESGSLDSLSFVELLLQIELAYGLRIPLQDLDLEHFRSIGRLAGFVHGMLKERAAPEQRRERLFGEPQIASRDPQPELETGYLYMETKCPA